METGAQIVVQTCQGGVVPCSVQEFVELVRNIVLAVSSIGIPVAIYLAGKITQRRRATLDLIKSFHNDAYIVDKMHRLYRYRNHDDDARKVGNPYDSELDLIWDHVIVLNFFEAACVEIVRGSVHGRMAIEAGGATIKGVREVLLRRMENLGICRGEDYPAMIAVHEKILAWEESTAGKVNAEIPRPHPS